MYEIVYIGDLLTSGCDMLVNPVNCIGVDGAGLALAFKQKFPDNSRFYQRSCHGGLMARGNPLLYHREEGDDPRFIVNFPTKHHWREKSNLQFIWGALTDLDLIILDVQPTSVAIPALGCGLGGLQFQQVEPMIRTMLRVVSDPNVDVRVYAPKE